MLYKRVVGQLDLLYVSENHLQHLLQQVSEVYSDTYCLIIGERYGYIDVLEVQ
jgi:hypothetical protein